VGQLLAALHGARRNEAKDHPPEDAEKEDEPAGIDKELVARPKRWVELSEFLSKQQLMDALPCGMSSVRREMDSQSLPESLKNLSTIYMVNSSLGIAATTSCMSLTHFELLRRTVVAE